MFRELLKLKGSQGPRYEFLGNFMSWTGPNPMIMLNPSNDRLMTASIFVGTETNGGFTGHLILLAILGAGFYPNTAVFVGRWYGFLPF